MFSSVGWGEILVLLIVGIVVVGPERLPKIITDIRAMIHAARNAISSAKEEFGEDFSEDFEDFRKPLEKINDVRRLGARGIVSKALLDDDPDFLRGLENSARAVTSAVTARDTAPSGKAKGSDLPATQPQEQTGEDQNPLPPSKIDPDSQTSAWSDVDDGDVL